MPATGPTTDSGKAASRSNSCKHGLTGMGVVLPPELAARVDQFQAFLAAQYRVEQAETTFHLRQMALAAIRLERCQEEVEALIATLRTDLKFQADVDREIEARSLRARFDSADPLAPVLLKRSSAGCLHLARTWRIISGSASAGIWDYRFISEILRLIGLTSHDAVVDAEHGDLFHLAFQLEEHPDDALAQQAVRDRCLDHALALERRADDLRQFCESPDADQSRGVEQNRTLIRLRRYETQLLRAYNRFRTLLEPYRREPAPESAVIPAPVPAATPGPIIPAPEPLAIPDIPFPPPPSPLAPPPASTATCHAPRPTTPPRESLSQPSTSSPFNSFVDLNILPAPPAHPPTDS